MFYVYLLECKDGSFYTGQTNDLQRRMQQHRSGRGAKYVRSRLPFEVRHIETYGSRGDAMRREMEIKKFPRIKKQQLFESAAR
ncbi:MAG: GIY-YIG nuclease family protein [Candidatus Kariarchaeaceae archaeon]